MELGLDEGQVKVSQMRSSKVRIEWSLRWVSVRKVEHCVPVFSQLFLRSLHSEPMEICRCRIVALQIDRILPPCVLDHLPMNALTLPLTQLSLRSITVFRCNCLNVFDEDYSVIFSQGAKA